MIVPSIDLMDGQAVQLIGGEKKAIEAGDPMPIARRFSMAGEIAVIDLDAALGRGDNSELIMKLLGGYRCRVGGGIRDKETAMKWLDAGATQVILGTAATPELLSQLPRDRVTAALDARHGEVVVEGWQKGTGAGVVERIAELKDYVGGFLVTMVEREGRMEGVDMDQVRRAVEAAGDIRVTVAGGVAKAEEIAEIDRAGADVQVGMALYSGKMSLADGIVAPMKSDRPDGLWATVIADELGRALGLAYSDLESVREAVKRQQGVYHSRSRGLWVKGLTSGDTQELLRIDLDCDRDAMRYIVRQQGSGFCHLNTWSCWGEDWGIGKLLRRLGSRVKDAPEGSYTKRLFDDPALLKSKLLEEAKELSEAQPAEVVHEAADVVYFTLVAMARAGVGLDEVEQELERRSLRVTRRPGDAK
ncbi:MAG: phosphoribosyl-ATP diphosphatase [Deltaproteobacteria bacterium]|nr:phosphoribosyl-ATP diphosphatase [Deltaproteobacteria bacterium]